MYKCSRCGRKGGETLFYPYSPTICRSCRQEMTKDWISKNKERHNISRRKAANKYRLKPGNVERQSAYYKVWYAKNGRKRKPVVKKLNLEVVDASV